MFARPLLNYLKIVVDVGEEDRSEKESDAIRQALPAEGRIHGSPNGDSAVLSPTRKAEV